MYQPIKWPNQTGFSLMELLIVMVILGMLAAIVGPQLWKHLGGAQQKATATQIANFEAALDAYRLDTFQYPASLDELVKNNANNPKWRGPYLNKGLPKDPWGNEYQYRKPGREGRDYDLFSFGADGQEGGDGDNTDVGNWQTNK
jgi:general secretion pathway protein G